MRIYVDPTHSVLANDWSMLGKCPYTGAELAAKLRELADAVDDTQADLVRNAVA